MDKMISISEAGKILGVTSRTLKRWDGEGKLKVYRALGNHRRYRLSEVTIEKLELNKEMAQDLISVVTCFSARLYGSRGGREVKKALEELERERQVRKGENNNKSIINK